MLGEQKIATDFILSEASKKDGLDIRKAVSLLAALSDSEWKSLLRKGELEKVMSWGPVILSVAYNKKDRVIGIRVLR